MLTKRQKQTLDFITSFTKKRGFAPSLEEIKKHLRLSSVSTAHHHVQRLQNAGYLQKEQHQPRALSTTDQKRTLSVPLIGRIAAGQPIEALEAGSEAITVSQDEVGKTGQHYALRVQGNSMIDEGIFDGDIVVVRKQSTAGNGQMVVAVIDENQATLKKLYREKSRFRLQPANPTLFPIYRDEVEVRGVIVKIIRNLDSTLQSETVKNKKLSRRLDYSWDYKGENTKTFTHGLHSYPAMFIPQVARRLLENYSQPGDVVCDIFCGSGTALVESKLLGRNAYGIDLNPLAIFLAKGKTTPLNPSLLNKILLNLLERLDSIKDKDVTPPSFNNLEFWFQETIIRKLARLKKVISTISDIAVRNFFLVAFSETVRLSSNTNSGEFKLVRFKPDKLMHHNPDVFGLFKKKAAENIAAMREFQEALHFDVWTKIIHGDSSKDNGLKENSLDCIITSPPYGDSRTTVAYGQFSRLSSQWIDVFDNPNDASKVDNDLLGGRAVKVLSHKLSSPCLDESLQKISNIDEKRAKEVLSFYIDLNECLKQAHRTLKPKKYFCLVVGNRLVKQVRIPTDFIIAELAEKIGFTCDDIFVRHIPGKRMPLKNSPTNVVGALEETMNKESVVVLRKA